VLAQTGRIALRRGGGGRPGGRWRRLGWVLAAIAAEVAAGCVYVGVHYVTDVLAGLVIGAAGSGAAWLALGLPGIAWLLAAADRALQAARLRPEADRRRAAGVLARGSGGRTGVPRWCRLETGLDGVLPGGE
jgi:membrane-associated phospholipid phosphatase